MSVYNKILLGIFTLLFSLIPLQVFTLFVIQPDFDLAIQNGRIIDPESYLDKEGMNIGIKNGKIYELTNKKIKGKSEINAFGLVIAPGFIDVLSYDPNPVGVWNKIADGVTTNLAMHGGTSDPKSWYKHYEYMPMPLNFGASFFYNEARVRMKIGIQSPAKKREIEKLVALAKQAIQEGCLGVSFSLEYAPGVSSEEVLAMMKLAKHYNIPAFFHLRYSSVKDAASNIKAISEVIGYARETGVSVHIDHINSTGGTFSMQNSLGILDKARTEGLKITACIYPYTFWAAYLNSTRFDKGWQDRFRIDYYDLQLAGSAERLNEETFKKYRKQGKVVVAYAIPEEDLICAFNVPYIMVASDGILCPGYNNHPRSSGTFARTLGLYSREKKSLPLMKAISKITLLPAKLMEGANAEFKKKGRLSVGADADITIFDYNTVIDKATVEHPEYMSNGIEYVIVNGVIVKDRSGLRKGISPGRPIRNSYAEARKKHKITSLIFLIALLLSGVIIRSIFNPNKKDKINSK